MKTINKKQLLAGLLLVVAMAPQSVAAMEQKVEQLKNEISENTKLRKFLTEKMEQQSLVLAFQEDGWYGLGKAYVARDEVISQPHKAPLAAGEQVANENTPKLDTKALIGQLKNEISKNIKLRKLLTEKMEQQSRSLLLAFQLDMWFVRRAQRALLKGEDEEVAAEQDLQKVFDMTMTLEEFIAQYFKQPK